MQKIILKIKYFEKELPKRLKKELYLFFQTQFPLMDKIMKNKKDLELVNSNSSGYKASSEKFLH